MVDTNIRVLPHVCGACKDLILPTFVGDSDLYEYDRIKKTIYKGMPKV